MSTRRRAAGLVLASMFLVFLACNDSPTEPDSEAAFQTVLKATLPGTAPDLQGREVVRDQATWQEVWTELRGTSSAPPAIDFRREMVVVVLGPGCGGDTTVSSITREPGALVVNAQTKSCGNTLCAIADFTVHTVRIPRSDTPVRLNVTGGSGLC